MKQPMIKIFGDTHKVKQIEFDIDGTIIKITYQIIGYRNKVVFKRDEIVHKDLIRSVKITEPTPHPYHDYAYAPDLESLLVY